ncbi:MAG: sigma factor-like helix-turn-helix DNA-binding protein [bacterium]|nr:sigma factor-like helix-turn-helix DNA-binding protein [bacterium]
MNYVNVNLKVLLMDTDFYARHAINSYLAWDRRTRVTQLCDSEPGMWDYLNHTPLAELPDVILMDADHLGGADILHYSIEKLRQKIAQVMVICLAQTADTRLIEASAKAGARGHLLKGEVRSQIAWAIVLASVGKVDFIVTAGIAQAAAHTGDPRLRRARTLPPRREYTQLTPRIRQAVELCVVNGMPAQLAADEMGISLHTIRSYIKEAYRILESEDETDYPHDMSPQERAFMRLTRFADEDD